MQEVERPACSAEFLVARYRSRCAGESVNTDPSLAKTGGRFGPVVCVCSVHAAVDLGQFVARVTNFEVAPHPVVLAVACFQKELTQGWRHFFHNAIIAE